MSSVPAMNQGAGRCTRTLTCHEPSIVYLDSSELSISTWRVTSRRVGQRWATSLSSFYRRPNNVRHRVQGTLIVCVPASRVLCTVLPTLLLSWPSPPLRSPPQPSPISIINHHRQLESNHSISCPIQSNPCDCSSQNQTRTHLLPIPRRPNLSNCIPRPVAPLFLSFLGAIKVLSCIPLELFSDGSGGIQERPPRLRHPGL
jgi:hypothetical protein